MFYIRYIGAMIYDGIILLSLFILCTAVCLLCRHGVAIPPASLWYQLTLLFILYGYHFQSYRYGGQTIGMRTWRLRLVSLSCSLSNRQIVVRLLLTIPALIYSILRIRNPFKLLDHWSNSQIINVYEL